jgi:hypothetical protein
MRRHYPAWDITRPLSAIFAEIVDGWKTRLRMPETALRVETPAA